MPTAARAVGFDDLRAIVTPGGFQITPGQGPNYLIMKDGCLGWIWRRRPRRRLRGSVSAGARAFRHTLLLSRADQPDAALFAGANRPLSGDAPGGRRRDAAPVPAAPHRACAGVPALRSRPASRGRRERDRRQDIRTSAGADPAHHRLHRCARRRSGHRGPAAGGAPSGGAFFHAHRHARRPGRRMCRRLPGPDLRLRPVRCARGRLAAEAAAQCATGMRPNSRSG